MSKQSQQTGGSVPQLRPIYATVDDFCKLSGIGRTTLYAALRDGHVHAKKVGTRTLINIGSGLAWIEGKPDYQAH